MNFVSTLFYYLVWHYTGALKRLTIIYRDIVFFITDFFSLKILLKSFFAPWRRLGEEYPKNFFNLTEILSTLIVNFLMRLVGMFIRLILIFVGILTLSLIVLMYPICVIFWLALPLFILLLFVGGLKLIF